MDAIDNGLPPPIFSVTSLVSLLAVLVLLIAAYTTSIRILPSSTTTKLRILFIWHLFDALVHFFLEGSYLYNCFFSFTAIPGKDEIPLPSAIATAMTPHGVHFLERSDRLYGAFYGTSPTSRLWQEYARADKRWGGSDLTVISLELLTVFVMGPLAVYICYCIQSEKHSRAWFWAMVVATGELYGGFMTFAPEWLSGSPNLDTSNFMFTWVYLFFFNTIWVWIPLWILYEAYNVFGNAVITSSGSAARREIKKIR